MRIGIDYTAAARQRAGIGRYTRELVNALLKLESPYRYVIFAAVGGLDPSCRKENIAPLHGHTEIRTLSLSDDWLARLWHRLRLPVPVEAITGPINLFYSPDFVLPPTRSTTRTLLTVHDLSFLRYPEAFVPPLCRYLEQVVPRSVARADLVLADSAHTRADLVNLLGTPAQKVRVLYSGVDARFCPQPEEGERQRLQARYGVGERPYILAVGTIQPRKNYPRLIQAFGRLDVEAQLVIAGAPGWLYQDTLTEAEKYGDRVRILGFVNDEDLPALYRNAVLFVFPSLYEGFGLPVLEAMACAVPVVCSNASSLPEVAGHAALLVDPLDTDGLAQAIAMALTDADLRREMVARGLAQAAQFTWKRAATQLHEAFDLLLTP
jgi:glycosyltransferase involved in cell wall biosynthesis